MKAGSGFIRFQRCRSVLGVMAMGFLAYSITLQGAPPRTGGTGRGGSMSPALINSGRPIPISQIPPGVGVRAITPEAARIELGDEFFMRGTGDAGDVLTSTGGPTGCEVDAECDDCNDCTADSCDAVTGNCVYDPVPNCTECDDDLFCNGIDKCDESGNCLDPSQIKEYTCVAGDTNEGLACNDATDPNGVCDSQANCQLQLVNPDPCRFIPDLLCDELETVGVGDTGACVPACREHADCDDTLGCNGTEVCVKNGTIGNGGFCIGGASPGSACAVDTDCGPEPGPDLYCGGVCRASATRPCGTAWSGYSAVCNEPGDCSNSRGRCCTPSGNDWTCSRTTRAGCSGGGALWMAIGDVASTPTDDGADPPTSTTCLAEADSSATLPGDTFLCPKYSAGVISGNINGVIGLAGAAACYPHWEIGDDYVMSNCKGDPDPWNPDDPGNSWYEVLSVRWIGGHVKDYGSRMRVTFYDHNGTFIEDRITEPAFPGGVSKNTVVFDQKPIVPCRGFVTIKPAVSFSANNKVQWAYTNASPQVGTSDANIYGRKHGICTAGTVGAGCNSDADCGGGVDSCNITSSVTAIDGAAEKFAPFEPIGAGTLALEIAGRKVPMPTGACCILDTGECNPQLPWVCESLGGFFQGEGTKCNICSNNFFQGCDVGEGCWVCDAGDREGELCGCPGGSCNAGVCDGGSRNGLNCSCAGGSCDTSSFCLPSPPACQISACCDDNGGCTEVTGNECVDLGGNPTGVPCATDAECGAGTCRFASGTCTGDNAGEFCVGDAECPGGECVAPCPVGTTSRGFGTKCKPNCCESTIDTGADLCTEAPVVFIDVPAVGQPNNTYTWTSNNKAATFGDRIEGDPPTGTCTDGIFNEFGARRDRGWWHAFSIDECADIRIDHCCTFEIDGRIHQPAWANLWAACDPCDATIGEDIVGPGSNPADPIGTKVDAHARGGPFCDFDDLWVTFPNVGPGTYWYNTYTAAGGHFGRFQLHVTVAPCVQAACCLQQSACIQLEDGGVNPGPLHGQACTTNEQCAPGVDGDRPDQVCVGDGTRPNEICCPDLPGDPGVCDDNQADPRCVGGSRNGLQCCADGGECKGNCPAGCEVLLESACDALGGYWMGFGNIPAAQNPVTTCESGICDVGSCCTGPGVCIEDLNQNCTAGNCCADNSQFCIDKKTCLGTNGTYVGGARCDFQGNPCPACQIEDALNCHNLDGANWTAPSDLSMKPGGFVQADDVILGGSGQINQICVWGAYFDGLLGPDDTHSCSGEVEDDFRVRFYADDGAGKPDHTALIAQAGGNPAVAALLGGVYVGPVASIKSETTDGTITPDNPLNLEVFTLTFGTMTIPTNETVWLEVANNTDTPVGSPTPQFNTCDWWIATRQSIYVGSDETGNDWSYLGTDYRPAGYPTDPAFNSAYVTRDGDTGYLEMGHNWTDTVFCLAGPSGPANFTEPEAPVGACCDCSNNVTEGQTLAQCSDFNAQMTRRWGRGLVGQEACLPPEGVPGDDCGSGAGADGQNCSAPPVIGGDAVAILDGGFEAISVCAGDSLDDCFGSDCLSGDFWTNYVTSCTGELVMSMCHTGIYYGNMDSYIAVYHNPGDPTNCPCPSSAGQFIIAHSDEGCNGEPDGGAGVVQGRIVFPGECYTARLGGWTDDLADPTHGISRLDVGCVARACFPSSAPTLQAQFGPLAEVGAPENKQRYLPIKAGDPDVNQSIRVTWDEQANWPGGHETLEGQTKWIQTLTQHCENSGQPNAVTPPFACGPSPGQPQKWYWQATLTCSEDAAYFGKLADLTNYCTGSGEACDVDADCVAGTCGVDGVIHIVDQGLNPTKSAVQISQYTVQVIEEACPKSDENNYSEGLVVVMPKWGDNSGGTSCPREIADGAAGIIPDVTNVVSKFANNPCAIKLTRADVTSATPDRAIGIDDVLAHINAFSAQPFPYAAGPACGAANARVVQSRSIRSSGGR